MNIGPQYDQISETAFATDVYAPGSVLFKSLLIGQLMRFNQETGKEAFYYLTFLGNNYIENMATLVVTSVPIRKFIVTAPEDKLDGAILWVKINNPHLVFPDGQMVAYNGEDFVNMRKSALMVVNTAPSVSPVSEQ